MWENLPQNHLFLTGSKPAQVYVNFNCMYMQIHEKKVVQIQCRNGTNNIMNEMESDWGSSIGHPSNYPLKKYHMVQRNDQAINRSEISSNLISDADSQEI